MEHDIRQMLNERVDDVSATPVLPRSTLVRARRRRLINSATALGATVALILGAVVVVNAVQRGPRAIEYVEEPIRPKHRTVVDVGGTPQEIVTGLGSVWVERQNEIARIDPRTNLVVARIDAAGAAGGRPVRIRYYFGTQGLAADDGAVWATGTRFTESVSPASSQPVESPTSAPDPQKGWLLLRIDPKTNTWVAAMPAYTGAITGSLPSAIAAGPGAVWAAAEESSLSGGAVYHIDTDSEEATRIGFDGPVTGIALLDGFVWAAVDVNRAGARSLVKIDPRTDRVVQTVLLPGAIALQGLVTTEGTLWVAAIGEGTAEIIRVEAASGRIIARIPVRAPVQRIAAGSSGIWFSVQDERQLFRIDPSNNQVDGRMPVGGYPVDLAVDGSTLWVITDPDSEGGPRSAIVVRFDL